jgi:hypothetical protein
MGLFDKIRGGLGASPDESLRERGIRGTARVLEVRETGMSLSRGGPGILAQDVLEVRLLLTLPDREPYEVTDRTTSAPPVGTECPVYVDP